MSSRDKKDIMLPRVLEEKKKVYDRYNENKIVLM
jgi:hypothetical protein